MKSLVLKKYQDNNDKFEQEISTNMYDCMKDLKVVNESI
jgi:hypothetical protein